MSFACARKKVASERPVKIGGTFLSDFEFYPPKRANEFIWSFPVDRFNVNSAVYIYLELVNSR